MEILYFIDRWLTVICKKVSNFFVVKTLLNRRIQRWAVLILAFGMYYLQSIFFLDLNSTGSSFSRLGVMLLIFIAAAFLKLVMVDLLSLFHRFIDPEQALGEKEYEGGYKVWATVLTGVLGISIAYAGGTSGYLYAPLIVGNIYLVADAPTYFVERRTNTRYKREKWSTALAKLIERCKDWLPKRQPVPV